MNHSLWELALYNRHRHDELLAERQTCAAVSLLPAKARMTTIRRSLGLRLIAAGRVLAGADAMRDAHRPMHPAL